MSAVCSEPIAFEELVAHWAGDLDPAREEAVELHLMGCAHCTQRSAGVAAITETMRHLIPPLLDRKAVDQLAARGLSILENPMSPGERREVVFPEDVDILLHRLGGLDLRDAVSVGFVLRDEQSARVLVAVDDAPFERATGEVLVACQQHYALMPHDTVAEVRTRDARGVERVASYTILHRFGPTT